MRIVWLPYALGDLVGIKQYYTKVAGKPVADKQVKKVTKATRLLEVHPYIGHPSPNDTDDDVLEWTIPNSSYTLPYMIVGDEIRILRVFDQRQERPDSWN